MSTPYHPESEVQSERINAIMEQSLHCYVSYQEANLVKLTVSQ